MTQDKDPVSALPEADAPAAPAKPRRQSARERNVQRVHDESVQIIEQISQQPMALQVALAPHGSDEDSSSADLPRTTPTAPGCAAPNTSG